MKQRELATGLSVSEIGYGAMGLSEFYGETDDKQSLALLEQLLELGVNFIDTADLYGRGHNEALIGRYLSKLSSTQRQQVKVATKCGIVRAADQAYARSIDNTPAYIRQSCDNALARLEVEQIDLFYLHRVVAEDIEQSMACLADLVKEGKIAHVGLCEVSAATLTRAHAVFPVSALQTEYSLWTRDIERSILPTLKQLGIGLVAYSPLGRGFLTGKLQSNSEFADNDFRKTNERFSDESINHNRQLLSLLEPIAAKYGATLGQLSLAWLLAQYDQLIPIPGTKNLRYLRENSAASAISLAADDIQMLTDLPQHFSVKGERYSQEGMKGVNV
uniref:aldo/keto reductase n=1 Tax=Thaumasiovibrio occultus TaxID=1891184 RepID=UPI000B34D3A3|nr:aldo/keto reductase [Thaumasiovibrio occultus]